MIIFFTKIDIIIHSIFFFWKKRNQFKKRRRKSILSCHPLLLEKKKRSTVPDYWTQKKLITISGIASWRNFFSPLIVFEMKKGGKFFGKKLGEIEKISWIKIILIQKKNQVYIQHWNRIINHGITWKLNVFWYNYVITTNYNCVCAFDLSKFFFL